MSEPNENKSLQEHQDYEQAVRLIDPRGHTALQFSYFLRRLDEVRAMDDEEVPGDTSDTRVFKDPRYEDALRTCRERFDEAAEAVASLLAAERAAYYTRKTIEHEASGMLIA